MSEFYEVLTRSDRKKMREARMKSEVRRTFKRLKIFHKPPVDRKRLVKENAQRIGEGLRTGVKSVGKALDEFDKARTQMSKDLMDVRKEGRKYFKRRRDDYDYLDV